MIVREQAIALVIAKLPEDMDVMEDQTIEKEYGWVIFSQSKKYIATGNFLYKYIGSGGELAEKSTGRIYEFGSAFALEENLKIYELGYFEYLNWDIEIKKVQDERKAIDYLSSLNLSYVIPEEAHGVIWRIAQKYTRQQLKQKLQKLPTRFNIGGIYCQYLVLESFKDQNTFSYELLENQGYENNV